MATERTYIINLRREWLKVPRYKRSKKAVKGLREFLAKNMKQPDISQVKIGSKLNEAVWARGMKNPPCKIKVTVIKEDDGLVKAELFGYKYIVKKKVEKKEEEGGIAGKLKSALGGKEEKEAEVVEEEHPKEEKEKKPKEEPAKKEVKKTETKKRIEKKQKPKPSSKKK